MTEKDVEAKATLNTHHNSGLQTALSKDYQIKQR